MADILKLIVDADIKGAVSEFKKLEGTAGSSLDGVEKKASSFGGKLKDGLSSLGAILSSAIGPAALAGAGAALGAFAMKGVDAFQSVALAAGKMSDATGLNVETASRYIAIADDIGVG